MSARKTQTLNVLLKGIAEIATQDVIVTGLSLDNRTVQSGDVFFACEGSTGHGKQYIDAAITAGAVAVLIENTSAEEISQLVRKSPKTPIVNVNQLSDKLGVIASAFYGAPSNSISLIGITGTNGKTSCSHLIAQCLNEAAAPCGVIGTLGAGVWGDIKPIDRTTPDALELQRLLFNMKNNNVASIAMEVSSHALDQGRVNACRIDVAVFTNLTRDHLDYHGDMASYGKSKLQLFLRPELKSVVVNLDDAFADTIIESLDASVNVIGITLNSLGTHQRDNNDIKVISASHIALGGKGLNFTIQSPWGNTRLESELLGDFNVSNLLTTLAVAMTRNISFDQAIKKLSFAQAPAGRLETFSNNSPLVVVDYAHTPDALEKVMQTLAQYAKGQLHVLFGCGGDRDKGKRAQMGALAENIADVVWLTDDNPRTEKSMDIIQDILSGIKNSSAVNIETNRKLAIQKIISSVNSLDDVILIAGKGHEEYQIVGDECLAFSDRHEVTQLIGVAA